MPDTWSLIGHALVAARRAANEDALVAIHVGSDIHEFVRSQAQLPIRPLESSPAVGLLYGFPLILEEDWPPGAIQVRVTRVIA